MTQPPNNTHASTPKRIAVLISGNGSNLQALIDACEADATLGKIALVLCNQTGAYGLKRAEKHGIASQVILHHDYENREAFDAAMDVILREHNIDLICLAGFMRLLSAPFVESWHGRMMNIHPSLLPAFKGAHAIEDALMYGVKITGCTVHYVTPEMDAGPIIAQKAVAVEAGDSFESLSERIHAAEHQLYPEALRLLTS